MTFARNDLLDAFLASRRWANAHPDLRDHHARRYRALASALGADLEAEPVHADAAAPHWPLPEMLADQGDHVWREANRSLHQLFQETLGAYQRVSSPYSGYLEAPPAVIAFHQHYAGELAAAADQLRAVLRRQLLDLVSAIWHLASERSVSADELRAHGFDPDRPAPDPDDYW